MAIVIERHPTAALSGDFGDIVVSNINPGHLLYELISGGVTLLSETYYPDASDKVTIRDIGRVCEQQSDGESVMMTDPVVSFQSKLTYIKAGADNVVQTVDFVCFPVFATTDETITPADLQRMPLHKTPERKCTRYTHDYFSCYGATGGVTVKAKVAFVHEGVNKYREITLLDHPNATDKKICHTWVAYANIVQLLNAANIYPTSIQYWDVRAHYSDNTTGQPMRYVLNDAIGDHSQFVYRNCLGGCEAFICRGLLSYEQKHARTFGYINSRYTRTSLESEEKHTVNSGLLTDADRLRLEDLSVSPAVMFSPTNGDDLRGVIITDDKIAGNNRRNRHDAHEISFRYHQTRTLRLHYTPREISNVMDETFDETFD